MASANLISKPRSRSELVSARDHDRSPTAKGKSRWPRRMTSGDHADSPQSWEENHRRRKLSDQAASTMSLLRVHVDTTTTVSADYVGYFHLVQEANDTLKQFGIFLKKRAARQCKQRKWSPSGKANAVSISVGGDSLKINGRFLSEPGQYETSRRCSFDRTVMCVHHSQVTFSVLVANTMVLVTQDDTLSVHTKNGDSPLLTAHVLTCETTSDASAVLKAVKDMVVSNKRHQAATSGAGDSVSFSTAFTDTTESSIGTGASIDNLSFSQASTVGSDDEASTSSGSSGNVDHLSASLSAGLSHNLSVSLSTRSSLSATHDSSVSGGNGMWPHEPSSAGVRGRMRTEQRGETTSRHSTPKQSGSGQLVNSPSSSGGYAEPYQASESIMKGLKTGDYVMGTPASLLGLTDEVSQLAIAGGRHAPVIAKSPFTAHSRSVPLDSPFLGRSDHQYHSDQHDQWRYSSGYGDR